MAIRLNISPRIIPSISSVYNNPNKIFMEYIDNSLDSAEEFFDRDSNSYKKKIMITLRVYGNNEKDGRIEIQDNSTGIDDITKVVTSIGNSDKKAQTYTNGQFGYGIHSFMATCNTLEVITKFYNSPEALYIPIRKEQFDVDSVEDVTFPDPKPVSFPEASGTLIRLSDFAKGSWKEIDLNEIKKEIVEHFELLLLRGNLTIKLEDTHGIETYCDSFDYNKIEGIEEKLEVSELEQMSLRGSFPTKSLFHLDSPIKIYIKITEGKIIDKPPLFFIKGRAVGKVGEIFKRSRHKSDIWAHPNITGYIDLAYNIEPTMARTDLKNDTKTKALFNYIENTLEPRLAEVLNLIKETNETKHYQSLENELNKALSKLAKIDSLNFRTEMISGNSSAMDIGSEGKSFELGLGEKDRGEKDHNSEKNPFEIGENEGTGFGPSDNSGDLPGEKGEGTGPIQDQENPYSENLGSAKKRSGFNIKIIDQNPVEKEENGITKLVRSQYIDGNILIYRMHPDFLERVDHSSRRGESKVSQRLVTYLAGEITVHYKDILQTRNGQPEYNKALFENLVEFIYQFESMLGELVGKNLSDISE